MAYKDGRLVELKARFYTTQEWPRGVRGDRARHYISAIGDLLSHPDLASTMATEAQRTKAGVNRAASLNMMAFDVDLLRAEMANLSRRLLDEEIPVVMENVKAIQGAASAVLNEIHDYQTLRSAWPRYSKIFEEDW